MTTERIAALVLVLLVALAPSLASAQRERPSASDASVTPSLHGVHLRDADEVLTPPSAGEYVMPVIGIVVGAALVVGGALALVVSGLMALGSAIDGHSSDTTTILLGVGLGGIAAGALSIVVSALGLSSLRHRARETEGPNLIGVALAPTDGGAAISAWGTF